VVVVYLIALYSVNPLTFVWHTLWWVFKGCNIALKGLRKLTEGF
jgi:hypothetical protein